NATETRRVTRASLASFRAAPDWLILLVFCVVFSLETLGSVSRKSATFDEPADLVSGYLELTDAQYWLKPETLPFAKMLAAAPLTVLGVKAPSLDGAPWKFVDRVLYQLNDADRLLMVARTTIFVVSLLLGGVVFAWTRQLFGRDAATFALLLYMLEPNLIA